jgi:BRCT domain type II-containing protein
LRLIFFQVDKGTLDVFLASGQTADAAAVVAEIERVLDGNRECSGASYVMVSGEAPELRGPSFEAAGGLRR